MPSSPMGAGSSTLGPYSLGMTTTARVHASTAYFGAESLRGESTRIRSPTNLPTGRGQRYIGTARPARGPERNRPGGAGMILVVIAAAIAWAESGRPGARSVLPRG